MAHFVAFCIGFQKNIPLKNPPGGRGGGYMAAQGLLERVEENNCYAYMTQAAFVLHGKQRQSLIPTCIRCASKYWFTTSLFVSCLHRGPGHLSGKQHL